MSPVPSPDIDRPPDGLPEPTDDGAADHLPGTTIPALTLPDTDGHRVDVGALAGRTVLYAYPRTGRPGEDHLVPDWDLIPGARGCTPQSCSFRDRYADITATGTRVYGVSTQSTEDLREVVGRLHLPFPLLSDAHGLLADTLVLPTFEVAGHRLLRRLTLVVVDSRIEHLWYPVFPPDQHAAQVLTWLRAHPL